MAAHLATSNALAQLGPWVFSWIALGVKEPVSMLYVPGPRSLFCQCEVCRTWMCELVRVVLGILNLTTLSYTHAFMSRGCFVDFNNCIHIALFSFVTYKLPL